MLIPPKPFTFLVAASDALPDSKTPADLVLDGVDDVGRIKVLLARLPVIGGHVHFTEGTYRLTEPITVNIDNLLISGRGRSTYLTYNGVDPCISAGTQTGWVIRDLRTDAGLLEVDYDDVAIE